MNARLRLVAGVLLAAVAAFATGCSLLPGAAPTQPVAKSGASSAASATPQAATQTPAPVAQTAFASEPAPRPANPVLTPGDWGFHSAVDYDDAGGGTQINSFAEQQERYKLMREQDKSLLSALKDSDGVVKLVEDADGDVSDIRYSVLSIDAFDRVGYSTPWVTATLRAAFPSEDGLKAVDVYVYRLKTHRGLDNTPYVSGTSVGYVDTDGSISNPTHPKFPR